MDTVSTSSARQETGLERSPSGWLRQAWAAGLEPRVPGAGAQIDKLHPGLEKLLSWLWGPPSKHASPLLAKSGVNCSQTS
jgi:hypothetical protein